MASRSLHCFLTPNPSQPFAKTGTNGVQSVFYGVILPFPTLKTRKSG